MKVTSSRSCFCSARVRMRRLFTESSCGADSMPCRKFTVCAQRHLLQHDLHLGLLVVVLRGRGLRLHRLDLDGGLAGERLRAS